MVFNCRAQPEHPYDDHEYRRITDHTDVNTSWSGVALTKKNLVHSTKNMAYTNEFTYNATSES